MSKNERKYPKGYWMSIGISIGTGIGTKNAGNLRPAKLPGDFAGSSWNVFFDRYYF